MPWYIWTVAEIAAHSFCHFWKGKGKNGWILFPCEENIAKIKLKIAQNK